MRVLVTGGSGFIGSHVVDRLRAAGCEPRIFDLAPPRYHVPSEVETILGSITDLDALTGSMEDCEAVVHLAAVADVSDVDLDPGRAEDVNIRGTWNVLEAAGRARVRRILYGSTVWVYGDCPQPVVDEETPIHAPRHLYTATKLAGELYLRSHAERQGIDYTILRFGIPYGPRARDAAVVPRMMAGAREDDRLTVAGTGEQSRPFVYVEDLADGVVRALAPGAANQVYNLTAEESTTIIGLARAVKELAGRGEIVHVEGRPDDFDGKEVSSARAERELGWRAATPLDEGLRRYMDWRSAAASAQKVLIISADVGEGHDLPARALGAGLAEEAPGSEVEIRDGLADLGRVTQLVVRDGSEVTFRWAPWAFDLQYWLVARIPPTRWLFLKACALVFGRRLLRKIREYEPDVVVSTYPGTTGLLGELRRKERLEVPVVSAITDLAGLRWWAHPGVDLHLVTHEESVPDVERIAGSGSVRWAQPPTVSGFLSPRPPEEARRSLDLPDGPVILVSGGGWGVGDLVGAVRTALSIRAATVVCLCGHNDGVRKRLERRFGGEPRLRLLGFTDRMSDLLAAADVLVHSTAGLTVLEAQIRGCRVVSYGFGVAHIRLNNRAYRRFGLAEVAGSRRALRSALGRALATPRSPDPRFGALPSPASLVLSARPRVEPVAALRRWSTRVAAVAGCSLAVMAWGLSTDDVYDLTANTLELQSTSAVATTLPAVPVLIDVPSAEVRPAARALARRKTTATFELSGDTQLPHYLERHGDEAIPRLQRRGPGGWLRTRKQLRREARRLGLPSRFFFAVRPDGVRLGQSLLAHAAGGSAVTAAVRFGGDHRLPAMRPGQVLEVEVPAGKPRSVDAVIGSAVAGLRRQRLRPVPLSALMDARGHHGSNGS